MNDYFVFGGCLRSELELPDLSVGASPEAPNWELRISRMKPPKAPAQVQGMHALGPGWALRLYRLADGYRLEFGETGSYDVLSRGRTIVWYPGPKTPLEVVRAVILGPVLALALYESGILCLHGSAVSIGGKAIVILAPKGYGKSTLAIALTIAGSLLMTDDLVAIDPSTVPTVLPGIHSVRMLNDTAERVAGQVTGTIVNDGWKKTLTSLPRHQLAWESAPLASIYLIDPATELPEDRAVRRIPLPLTQAVAFLAHQKKLGDDLVGYGSAGAMLRSIAAIASAVPVYRLEVVRDLERLPEVVRELLAWHGSPALIAAPFV